MRRAKTSLGIAAALCMAAGEPACAADWASAGQVKIAAAARDPLPPPGRREAGGALDGLFAQSAPANSAGASSAEDTVLALFPLDAREGIEAEVANAHRLELVGKPMVAFGLRLARYRIPDARPIAAIVDRLRADARVQSAQINVRYRSPDQEPPATAANNAAPTRARAAERPAERKYRPAGPKAGQPERGKALARPLPSPSQTASVGDVLAGGL